MQIHATQPIPSPGTTPEKPAVTAALNAILFREILKPLASALGPAGDIAIGRVADAIFTRRST